MIVNNLKINDVSFNGTKEDRRLISKLEICRGTIGDYFIADENLKYFNEKTQTQTINEFESAVDEFINAQDTTTDTKNIAKNVQRELASMIKGLKKKAPENDMWSSTLMAYSKRFEKTRTQIGEFLNNLKLGSMITMYGETPIEDSKPIIKRILDDPDLKIDEPITDLVDYFDRGLYLYNKIMNTKDDDLLDSPDKLKSNLKEAKLEFIKNISQNSNIDESNDKVDSILSIVQSLELIGKINVKLNNNSKAEKMFDYAIELSKRFASSNEDGFKETLENAIKHNSFIALDNNDFTKLQILQNTKHDYIC